MAILLSKDEPKWALARLDVWIRMCGWTLHIGSPDWTVWLNPYTVCILYRFVAWSTSSTYWMFVVKEDISSKTFFVLLILDLKIYIYIEMGQGLVLELISPVVLQQLNFLYYLFNLWFDSGWQHANSETQIIFVLHNLY